MLSILCDSIGKHVQAFDDCVIHAFPGTTIQRLTSKIKRQPNLVRNATFVLIHVGTNNVHSHTPAEIRRLFELLVDQIVVVVPNARIMISAILPRLCDFDATNDYSLYFVPYPSHSNVYFIDHLCKPLTLLIIIYTIG